MTRTEQARLLWIEVERYKGYRQRTRLELRPLTILVGKNNSGKSAIMRAIPLLARGLVGDEPVPLALAHEGLILASTFRDFVSGRALHGNVEIRAGFSIADVETILKVRVQAVVEGRLDAPVDQVVHEWSLEHGSDYFELRRTSLDLSDSTYLSKGTGDFLGAEEGDRRVDVAWHGLLPDLPDAPPWFRDSAAAMRNWGSGLRYLSSPRSIDTALFLPPKQQPLSDILASMDDIQRETREWYRSTFNVAVEARIQGELTRLEVTGKTETHVDIAHAGQGLAQVLPVVVLVCTRNRLNSGVDIVEHPEAEVHPGAHVAIAELLLEHCTEGDRPLLVETHSEMMLLRTRRWVAEGRLSVDDVKIYWVDDTASQTTRLRSIELTERGAVKGWPEGVFYENYEEILAIRRAAREAT